jgi:3-hydroxyisobutyrate dehydrogenase
VRAFDLSEAALAKARSAAAAARPRREAVPGCRSGGHHAAGRQACREVYANGSVFGKAPQRAILIDCSTIDVATAARRSRKARAPATPMVDAPVSGGIAAAEGGTLTFMVGGSPEGFERARPFLEQMGKAVIHAGGPGGPGGQDLQQHAARRTMIATCETFVLAQKLGLDPQTFFDISVQGFGPELVDDELLPGPRRRPETPADRGYEGGFAAR